MNLAIKLYKIAFGNGCGLTAEGGIYQTFVNNTATETSKKGTIVIASTSVEGGVDTAPAGSYVPIGIILEDNIPKGSNVKVVTYGKANVLLESTKTSKTGYWCGVSNSENGRMYQIQNAPVGASTHSQEIGHSLQTVSTSGALSLIQVHFN